MIRENEILLCQRPPVGPPIYNRANHCALVKNPYAIYKDKQETSTCGLNFNGLFCTLKMQKIKYQIVKEFCFVLFR